MRPMSIPDDDTDPSESIPLDPWAFPPPIHPGALLRDIIANRGTSAYRVARAIGVTATLVSRLVNEKQSVTPRLSLLLGRYFSQSPGYWLSAQAAYDLAVARAALGPALDVVPVLELADDA